MSEYNSFYGGRRGASFVIAKSFPSIAEMIAEFRKGGNYKTVNYDEYVLIDTVKKTNPDNGKIYKRGYDYNNDQGGAIYIGQIVGPQGVSPNVRLDTYPNVRDKREELGFTYDRTSGTFAVSNSSLVPGKDGSTYHDAISWACCTVRTDDGTESTAYIGFQFPYLVLEFTSEGVSPYTTGELASRVDDKSHPFYEKFKITVPKGKMGDAFKNLKVMKATKDIKTYTGQDDDVAQGREVLVYEHWNYEDSAEGKSELLYIGDYNMIDNIQITENGLITIDYSHDDNEQYQLRFINNIELREDGTVVLKYTSGADVTLTQKIKWIVNSQVSDDGSFSVLYNTDTERTQLGTIKWVDKVRIEDDGDIYLKYNSEADELKLGTVKWIDDMKIENGEFSVKYNTDSKRTVLGTITWLEELNFEDDGSITYRLNTDPEGTKKKLGQFRWIEDVTLSEEGKLTVKYNDLVDRTDLGTIRWIKDMKVENGEFSVLYNDNPERETLCTITWLEELNFEEDGSITYRLSTDPPEEKRTLGRFRWIEDIDLSDTGDLSVKYNDLDERTPLGTLKWIDEVTLADNGDLSMKFNNETDPQLLNNIKWVDEVSLADNGDFSLKYNNEETGNVLNTLKWTTKIEVLENGDIIATYNNTDRFPQEKIGTIKSIKSLAVDIGDSEGEGTQKLKVTYVDGTEELIGEPINYIIKSAVSEDYHLLFLWSSPAVREQIKLDGNNYEFDGRDDWQDMGSIKSENGILIGKNFDLLDYPQLNSIEEAIKWLNEQYPSGLTGVDLHGKVVTIGLDDEDKFVYAFDYSLGENTTAGYEGWFFLSQGVSRPSRFEYTTMVATVEEDETTEDPEDYFLNIGSQTIIANVAGDPTEHVKTPEMFVADDDPSIEPELKDKLKGSVWFVSEE